MTEVERIYDFYEIYFPKLGWRFSINPTAFTIFGIDIQWYGIIITVGLLLAMLYCFPKMKRFGLDGDRVIDVVIGGVIGGIIGARAYYVINEWENYAGNWREIFNTRNGGLAFYGGLIGAVLVGIVICRIRKVKILPMLDIAVIGFLIGQGVGRWGNFVNQEAFGTNTNSIFGMTGGTIQQTIINQTQIGEDMYLNGNATMLWEVPVHPCFLYESIWCLLGFVLLAWYSKRRKYDGQLALLYLMWYGAERFVVEGLRTDSLMFGSGNIRTSQALSAVFVVVSVIIQIVMFSRVKRDPERYVLYCNTEESKRLLAEAEKNRLVQPVKDKNNDGEQSDSENKGAVKEGSSEEDKIDNDIKIIQEDDEDGSDN